MHPDDKKTTNTKKGTNFNIYVVAYFFTILVIAKPFSVEMFNKYIPFDSIEISNMELFSAID